MTIERDFSAQAAETASKLQLENMKRIAKLEAECRRLQSIARKSSPVYNQKSFAAASTYAESLTDSNTEANGSEPGSSDSLALALISELDQLKNGKQSPKILAAEISMMDDFLEMERLASLPETRRNTEFAAPVAMENYVLKGEYESMIERVAELEQKLEKLEAEKLGLQNALDESQKSANAAQSRTAEAQIRLEELQNELTAATEAKVMLELQLIGMEVEARTMSENVNSLKAEIETERKLSAELTVKCQELENEPTRTANNTDLQQNTTPNGEVKVKQEDLTVAADKLAECQKTIASLGMQLKSLATLEDFLIDTSNIPGFSSFKSKCDPDPSGTRGENHGHPENGNVEGSSAPSALAASSTTHMNAAKSRNGFGKFFSRSKSLVGLDSIHD